jgi:hypothetical protein
MRYVIDDVFLAKSEELGLLKVLWLYIEASREEWYYVLYLEKIEDLDNEQGFNIIAINNNIEVKIPSLSKYYTFLTFKTRKEIDNYLNHNDLFKLLEV